ncbi:hypothetical protein AAFF_G00359640 [Aldrovandia affinis]|uniref:Uncharacterized protein n=1 Tax=Aldrovandia affinis TaxID=143900 RepID=A0AAD7WNC3_9TELE|nr:hypothetical protein AAFF_G00359640 [Aldrovandia affinis]
MKGPFRLPGLAVDDGAEIDIGVLDGRGRHSLAAGVESRAPSQRAALCLRRTITTPLRRLAASKGARAFAGRLWHRSPSGPSSSCGRGGGHCATPLKLKIPVERRAREGPLLVYIARRALGLVGSRPDSTSCVWQRKVAVESDTYIRPLSPQHSGQKGTISTAATQALRRRAENDLSGLLRALHSDLSLDPGPAAGFTRSALALVPGLTRYQTPLLRGPSGAEPEGRYIHPHLIGLR